MAEDKNVCCICGKHITRGAFTVPLYLCTRCYREYEEDVRVNAPWVRYLINDEKQRRKRRNRKLTWLAKGVLCPVL